MDKFLRFAKKMDNLCILLIPFQFPNFKAHLFNHPRMTSAPISRLLCLEPLKALDQQHTSLPALTPTQPPHPRPPTRCVCSRARRAPMRGSDEDGSVITVGRALSAQSSTTITWPDTGRSHAISGFHVPDKSSISHFFFQTPVVTSRINQTDYSQFFQCHVPDKSNFSQFFS